MASSGRPRPAEADPQAALEAALSVLGAAPRVAVAYSGGLDSTVLLHVAAGLLPAGSLHAFHVDHGLQAGSADWARHCETQARALGVPVRILRLTGGCPAGESLEAWAREARYAALQRAADEAGLAAVLTAHQADDQIETVLLRLARGAGLDGITGISPDTRHGRLRLLRPWLAIPRSTLRDWAESRGLSWIEDPSNTDLRYTRNAVRERLLPVLDEVLPGFRKRLPASLLALREARDLLRGLEARDLAAVEVESGAFGRCLSLSAWRALPADRRAGVLRRWLSARGCRMPSRARLAEMLRQLESPNDDRDYAVHHDGRCLRRHRDLVVLVGASSPFAASSRVAGPQAASAAAHSLRWAGESRIDFPGLGGALLIDAIGEPGHPGLGADLLRGSDLILRRRSGGERLRMREGGPHRSLKNLFQEHGIPSWQRPNLPVLWASDRLVWVAGLGSDADVSRISGERYLLRWEANEAHEQID